MSLPAGHLAQEAIAALVDGELSCGAARRAAGHLSACLQCRLAVAAQREAKEALHDTGEVVVPGDLLCRLRAIPFTADVAADGLTMLAAGPDQLTSTGAGGSFALSLSDGACQPSVGQESAAEASVAGPVGATGRPGRSRWLLRGMVGVLTVTSLAFAALVVSLPAAQPRRSTTSSTGSAAQPAVPVERAAALPSAVRTLTIGRSAPVPVPAERLSAPKPGLAASVAGRGGEPTSTAGPDAPQGGTP